MLYHELWYCSVLLLVTTCFFSLYYRIDFNYFYFPERKMPLLVLLIHVNNKTVSLIICSYTDHTLKNKYFRTWEVFYWEWCRIHFQKFNSCSKIDSKFWIEKCAVISLNFLLNLYKNNQEFIQKITYVALYVIQVIKKFHGH